MVSLSEDQLCTINNIFKTALEKRRRFTNADDICDHLRKSGISDNIIDAHKVEILNCHLVQGNKANNGQLPSPSSSPVSHEVGLGLEDVTEQVDQSHQNCEDVPLSISEETHIISAFRPQFNDFSLINASDCKGNTTYISDALVRKCHLAIRRSHILLQWRYTGTDQTNRMSTTRCKVIKAKCLPPRCDIAFGENHSTEDGEVGDGGRESVEYSSDSQFDDSAYQGSERILSDDRIPEPREDWEGIVTRVGAAVASAVTASVLEVTKTMFDQKRPRQSRPIDGDTPFKRARKR